MQDAKGLTRGINHRFCMSTFCPRPLCVIKRIGIKKVTHVASVGGGTITDKLSMTM